jgi:molybdate transport repressor ModE-like protein
MKISTLPAWKFIIDDTEVIEPALITLLRYLQKEPKLTKAAEQAGISYRHAWNILNKWNNRLGSPLVTQSKGQGTHPTYLGEKLVWAEDLIEARLTPAMGSLVSTINRELNGILNKQDKLLRLHASHGYAVEVLSKLIPQQSDCVVETRYMGSSEAIESLINNNCDLAGFHLCTHPLVRKSIRDRHYHLLHRHDCTIIKMVYREQGFIVQKNNPKSLNFLSNLIIPNVTFINRQKSAGTRILLDELLSKCNIDNNYIKGYNNEEYTHTAVAAHVASGAADIGFGIEYAARKFNLDFIPIVSEQYVLACKSGEQTSTTIESLVDTIKSHEFARQICELPGYQLDSAGSQLTSNEFLYGNVS